VTRSEELVKVLYHGESKVELDEEEVAISSFNNT